MKDFTEELDETYQALSIIDTLIENTVQAHWDIAACNCIICVLGHMMGFHATEMKDRFGKTNASLRFRIPTLVVEIPSAFDRV